MAALLITVVWLAAAWRASDDEHRVLQAVTLAVGGVAATLTVMGLIGATADAPHLVLFSLPAWLWACRTSPARMTVRKTPDLPSLILSVIVCVAALLLAISAPPRGYDPLWFHLPTADHFWRTGSLVPDSDLPWAWHPGLGTAGLGAVLSVTRDSGLNAISLPFLGVTALATQRLSQQLGGQLPVHTWIVTTPCLWFLSQTPYLDVPAIAMGTVGLLWWTRNRPLLAGLAFGSAVAIKLSMAPICGLAMLGMAIEHRKVTVISAFTAATGFWFARNTWFFGWPLYPIHAGVVNPGKEVLVLGGSSWRWLVWPVLPTAYSHEWGLGVLPGILAFIVVLALPWWIWRGSRHQRALAVVAVLHLLPWWMSSREFRHLLPLWPVLLALASSAAPTHKWLRRTMVVWAVGAFGHSLSIALTVDRWGLNPERQDWHAYYGLPPDYDSAFPAGTRIVNDLHPTHAFGLAGSNGQYAVTEAACGITATWHPPEQMGPVLLQWTPTDAYRWWEAWSGPHPTVYWVDVPCVEGSPANTPRVNERLR